MFMTSFQAQIGNMKTHWRGRKNIQYEYGPGRHRPRCCSVSGPRFLSTRSSNMEVLMLMPREHSTVKNQDPASANAGSNNTNVDLVARGLPSLDYRVTQPTSSSLPLTDIDTRKNKRKSPFKSQNTRIIKTMRDHKTLKNTAE